MAIQYILNLEQLSHLSMDDPEWEVQKAPSLHACTVLYRCRHRDVPGDLNASQAEFIGVFETQKTASSAK